jgi:hypothetical protein
LSYIILRGRWFHIVVLNVHAPTEDKIDDVKDGFYEKLECIFDKFSKYHMKMLLGDLHAKVGREDNFKHKTGNESLNKISNFTTSENLTLKSTMFTHHNIHKHTWTSPDWNTHIQIDNFLIYRRRHSSVLDVQSFRAADCDRDYYLVVVKLGRE